MRTKKIQKPWHKENIQKLIDTNDIAVERAIVRIYSFQTYKEQNSNKTIDLNNMGFSSHHAKLGTYLANWIKQDKHLSGKFLDKGRKMIRKYWKQLAMVANKEV